MSDSANGPHSWADRRSSTLSRLWDPWYEMYYDGYSDDFDPQNGPGETPLSYTIGYRSYLEEDREHWSRERRFQAELLAFIDSITSVEFPSTHKVVPRFVPPGIHIPGIGAIAFPLLQSDIDKLVAGREIPNSRGGTTNTNYGILELTQVDFLNPAWSDFIAELALEASKELGMDGDVHAEFCKLVIHGKDSSNVSYDTAETSQAFAKLVVCLPTKHSGGDVELRHEDKVIRYSRDKTSEFSISYAAWSPAFEYKVHPVSSGNQVVLVYDLLQRFDEPPSYEPRLVSLFSLEKQMAAYRKLLEKWQELDIPFIVFVLNRPYSDMDLSTTILRDEDAVKAKFLNHIYSDGQSLTTKFVPLLARMTLCQHLQNDGIENELDEVVYLEDTKEFDGDRLPRYGQRTRLYIDAGHVLQEDLWLGRRPDRQFGGEYGTKRGIDKEYRNTVIILVKESCFAQFMIGQEPNLEKWDPSSSRDMDSFVMRLAERRKSKAASTCYLLLQLYDSFANQNDDRPLGTTALCAVHLGNASLFRAVVGKLSSHFALHVYEFLGGLIDVDEPVVDLDDLMDTFTTANSLAVVRSCTHAFAEASGRIRSSIQLQSFIRSAVYTVLKTSQSITDADKKAFLEIPHELDGPKSLWKSVMLDGLKSFLARHPDEDFVSGFILSSHKDSLTDSLLVRSVLPVARSTFRLSNFFYWGARGQMNWSLKRFLTLIDTLAPEELPGFLDRILEQAKLLQKREHLHVLKTAIEHPLCSPEFCQKLFESYLIHKVTPEPQRLEDWARSDGKAFLCPCGNNTCGDCRAVRDFLLGSRRRLPYYTFDAEQDDKHWKEFLEVETKDGGKTTIRRIKKLRDDHDAWLRELRELRGAWYNIDEDALEAKLGSKLEDIMHGKIIRTSEDPPWEDSDDESDEEQSDEEQSDEEQSDEELSDEEPRLSRRVQHQEVEWTQTILPFYPIRRSAPGAPS